MFLMVSVSLVGIMMGSEKQSCTHSEELSGVMDFHGCLVVVVSLVGIMAGSEKHYYVVLSPQDQDTIPLWP